MDFTEINHLLELARLELSNEEKEKIAHDLAKILEYVNQLQEVKTDNLEPMAGGTFSKNILRDDEINSQKLNLEKEGYFEVPPIFD
jgi:aspartyl-tRNA(Asn)/glutamyl-tRNA(Gln) amidotransferase subunit C